MAEQFTGRKGVFVPLDETLQGFEKILNGDLDNIPERFFYMTGTIDQVVQAYEQQKKKSKQALEEAANQEAAQETGQAVDRPEASA